VGSFIPECLIFPENKDRETGRLMASAEKKSKKVVIVGGVAGGASCAVRLRRMDEFAEIIMLERGPYVSFANCGLPYFIGEVIKKRSKLLVATPERFRNIFNIDVRTRHEVLSIDRQAGEVEIRDHEAGSTYRESYDNLVLAPGAAPIRPPLEGIDLPGIFSLRNIPDSDAIKEWMVEKKVKKAVVVGAGFIGLEMVENLVHRNIETTLVEMLPQVMPPMDPEMVVPVHNKLRDKGVNLQLGSPVFSFEKGAGQSIIVKTKKGDAYEAEMVILGLGVRPDVGFIREAGIELGECGGIKVDARMRTSDPAIFAVGDAVETSDFITGAPTLLPLAGPANRQGRIVADVLCGRPATFRGVQGTSVCGLFDLIISSTGANEKTLEKTGIPFAKVYAQRANHVGYYPGGEMMDMKLLFSAQNGKVLGAQAVGGAGTEKRIDVLAMAIQKGATVYDLEEAELCYAPQYGAAKDPVNIIASVAANHLRGDGPVVDWEDFKEVCGEKPLILDVREPEEYKQIYHPDAVHIPLGQLRDRLEELPKDREIWAHCASGQRSYYASRILLQNGFNAKNITGSMDQYKARQEYEGELESIFYK
jgi:NADPH-dependent 2,4-dienoyl-CoA reductase/sulfur reductase-like enzyme/rhodanese-related sulfurtransferase